MNIAVVMGGYSDESVISLKSGQLILNHLDTTKYTVYEVHILLEEWYALIEDKKYPINKNDFSFVLDSKKINFDVAINTVHGMPGENGHLQAYWDLIGLPYTGCSFYQSAISFNKRDTLSILSKFNIPKANSIYASKGDVLEANVIVQKLGLPFFVKPNQSGSSLGISKVNDISQFQTALDFAFAEDNDILLESFLNGTEVSVGVLKYEGKTTVLAITEIVSENDFFDYEAKYQGKSEEITPARISKQEEDLVKEIAVKVYDSLNMSGFTRAEYILVDGIPHFLEINTNPGLSPQSIFPQQVSYANLNMSDLLDNEIQFALNRKLPWK